LSTDRSSPDGATSGPTSTGASWTSQQHLHRDVQRSDPGRMPDASWSLSLADVRDRIEAGGSTTSLGLWSLDAHVHRANKLNVPERPHRDRTSFQGKTKRPTTCIGPGPQIGSGPS
jgi:hypothetical protein